MALSVGFWSCGDWAMAHERDLNAARHLQRRGLAKAEVTRGDMGRREVCWQALWLHRELKQDAHMCLYLGKQGRLTYAPWLISAKPVL